MTFSSKFRSVDEARAAVARSLEAPEDVVVADNDRLKLGTAMTLEQHDLDAAQESLSDLWNAMKQDRGF